MQQFSPFPEEVPIFLEMYEFLVLYRLDSDPVVLYILL